jgi:hypothetical protein
MKARPLVSANGQAALWRKTGLEEVVELVDRTDQIAQRLQALPSELCAEIERHVRAGYLYRNAGRPALVCRSSSARCGAPFHPR